MALNCSNRCCFMAKLMFYEDGWRFPVTKVAEFGGVHLCLCRCKYCEEYWVRRLECVGHRDWIPYWERIDSPESYEQVKLAQKADYEKRIEQRKEQYRINGWEWKS